MGRPAPACQLALPNVLAEVPPPRARRRTMAAARPVNRDRDLAPPVRHRGTAHDLAALRDDLAARYFGQTMDVAVTWGRGGTGRALTAVRQTSQGASRGASRGTSNRPPCRSIRMGAYLPGERAIRIHPALDQAWVPRYFVEWVVFHEMLHHVVPMPVIDGRRCCHTPEFRARERAFHAHERAREWERRNLPRLIASRDG